MPLTKTEILQSPVKLKKAEVPVPEWGDGATVLVRELTGDERDRFDLEAVRRQEATGSYVGLRAWLVSLGLCDEEGESLGFTEAEVEQLGSKSGAAIDRVFERIQDLSGMNSEAVKVAEKN